MNVITTSKDSSQRHRLLQTNTTAAAASNKRNSPIRIAHLVLVLMILFLANLVVGTSKTVLVVSSWVPTTSTSPSEYHQHQRQQQHNETFLAKRVKQLRENDPYLWGKKDAFSACLIWMDDNHRLPEWLSYHYFTMPLRNLIIAVDPHSNDQLPKIQKEWFSLMNITIWHDHDYINTKENLRREPRDDSQKLERKHNTRQKLFFQECTRHLQKRNQKFAMYLDTDEFITISDEYYAKNGDAHKFATDEFKKTSGQIVQVIQTHRKDSIKQKTKKKSGVLPSYFRLDAACTNLPRAQYGAGESSFDERQKMVPEWIDAMNFDTLRFRCRSTPIGDHHHMGKVFMDLSKITNADFSKQGDAHRPLRPACDLEYSLTNYGEIPV
eukprot:scaffold4050_cov55-Cylindrotheca_fusiformis.AAC.2